MNGILATIAAATILAAGCAGTPRVEVSHPVPPAQLEGTSWKLVGFQGGDGERVLPDDGSHYTIQFKADGELAARIDCNRGRGTWKTTEPNALALGPMALTRTMCPAGSMHDRIVKHWSLVRFYVLENGHLYLSLMADGGIYEFEPM